MASMIHVDRRRATEGLCKRLVASVAFLLVATAAIAAWLLQPTGSASAAFAQRVDDIAEALPAPMPDERMLALDEALDRLAALDSRQAQVVELRYFAGLSVEDAAALLGLSPTTVKRDWATARAWLFDQVRRTADG